MFWIIMSEFRLRPLTDRSVSAYCEQTQASLIENLTVCLQHTAAKGSLLSVQSVLNSSTKPYSMCNKTCRSKSYLIPISKWWTALTGVLSCIDNDNYYYSLDRGVSRNLGAPGKLNHWGLSTSLCFIILRARLASPWVYYCLILRVKT